MKTENIILGRNIIIDPSTSINNIIIGDNVKVSKRCSLFGGTENLLEIGTDTTVAMNTIINGLSAKIKIGSNVSIAQNVNIMTDSGPNASQKMQLIFPIEKGPVTIGNHVWIGASVIIMPNIIIDDYCIVAANSYVNKSFPPFSIIGGSPAKLIRTFTEEEINKLNLND